MISYTKYGIPKKKNHKNTTTSDQFQKKNHKHTTTSEQFQKKKKKNYFDFERTFC